MQHARGDDAEHGTDAEADAQNRAAQRDSQLDFVFTGGVANITWQKTTFINNDFSDTNHAQILFAVVLPKRAPRSEHPFDRNALDEN